ncbi:MAG: MBOAT family protein [Tannerellaceae bacterium]|jgi:D-alanyl-lipoteichoic acid acyltransferase DltB (MBOAT superfamily)|nr:MBOAT family protein [Tannerellaceae bacterium]
MLFNSFAFGCFMIIVFLIYWSIAGKTKLQNIFLLAASYFFYGWWDWRFLSLVLLCSLVNYVGGLLMMSCDDQRRRKLVLTVCCLASFGVLGLFKYYDFFILSLSDALAYIGLPFHATSLRLILPVGISFYTFHTLSYTIDVYRRRFEPTRDIVAFFLFVSIFPLAMAGPIERASNLLPQIYRKRKFDYDLAVDGLRQILWGLFKKAVIADRCASCVDTIFMDPGAQSGSTLALGAILFAFQIYGDFSGYSDMALGVGKLLGFRFLSNFSVPYFSRDIAEFWRRWHISLNTWFRDYLYIPLGGSRGPRRQVVRNTFAIFLISGLWHGANWTFVAWGAFHALLFLPSILSGRNRRHTDTVAAGRRLPTVRELLQMSLTFLLVTLGWIFFRAETIGQAWEYILGIVSSPTLLSMPNLHDFKPITALFILIFILVEWLGRELPHPFAGPFPGVRRWPLRFITYYALILIIVLYAGSTQQFIYFQF